MEAATTLRFSHVRAVGNRVSIDGLVVEDEAAARLVREREEAGSDPAATITDAIEIGPEPPEPRPLIVDRIA